MEFFSVHTIWLPPFHLAIRLILCLCYMQNMIRFTKADMCLNLGTEGRVTRAKSRVNQGVRSLTRFWNQERHHHIQIPEFQAKQQELPHPTAAPLPHQKKEKRIRDKTFPSRARQKSTFMDQSLVKSKEAGWGMLLRILWVVMRLEQFWKQTFLRAGWC